MSFTRVSAPPPSYDSLFGRVREARKTSKGVFDFLKNILIILLGAGEFVYFNIWSKSVFYHIWNRAIVELKCSLNVFVFIIMLWWYNDG